MLSRCSLPQDLHLEGAEMGFKTLSADLCSGWDFRRRADRNRLFEVVRVAKPALLQRFARLVRGRVGGGI